MLQRVAECRSESKVIPGITPHCSTLQHTATHCNTLHPTATHRNLMSDQEITTIGVRMRCRILSAYSTHSPHFYTHTLSIQYTTQCGVVGRIPPIYSIHYSHTFRIPNIFYTRPSFLLSYPSIQCSHLYSHTLHSRCTTLIITLIPCICNKIPSCLPSYSTH